MSIGSRITQIRGKESREAFAKQVGVHPQTLYMYEKDKRKLDVEIVSKICEFSHASAEWLIFGRGPMFTTDNVAVVRATAGSLTAGAPIASFVATPSGPESACSRCAALEAEVRELRADLKKSQDEALTAYKLALEAARPKIENAPQHLAELLKIRENTIKIEEKLQEAHKRIAELEEQLAEATSPAKKRKYN